VKVPPVGAVTCRAVVGVLDESRSQQRVTTPQLKSPSASHRLQISLLHYGASTRFEPGNESDPGSTKRPPGHVARVASLRQLELAAIVNFLNIMAIEEKLTMVDVNDTDAMKR
jgi:hypothetical protein